jgi:hypothetical protein
MLTPDLWLTGIGAALAAIAIAVTRLRRRPAAA